jgi:hypothetical protein
MIQKPSHFIIYIYRHFRIICEKFFSPGIIRDIKNAIPKSIIQNNRKHLLAFKNWVPDGLLESSVFRYGVNPHIKPLLDRPINNAPTNADLLAFFATHSGRQGRYLEIGVSVGKTFWQIMNSAVQFECWAFDIEEISPVLKEELTLISRVEWQTPGSSIKKSPSSFTTFLFEKTGQRVYYICADVFDSYAWTFLKDVSFNIILSDALHAADALDFEWGMLMKTNALSRDFFLMIWDDLDGEMKDWFLRNKFDMAAQCKIPAISVGEFFMNGWLGSREFPHRYGYMLKPPECFAK